MSSLFWAERAWIDGETASDVTFTTRGGVFEQVSSGAPRPAGAARLDGFVLPGMVNAHSHVFHRALRNRVAGGGDFWSWRQGMYELVEGLDPDSFEKLATATFAEMLVTGITMVGEFHYLHHGKGGVQYSNPNEMSAALVRAAEAVGIRMCLLDTCYLMSGVDGTPLEGPQLRFSDGQVSSWRERHALLVDELGGHALVHVGAAIHSVRAVPPEAFAEVVATGGPVHVHVSEQPAENDACRALHGLSPIGLLAAHDGLGERTTAVHAIHVSDDDIERLAGAGASVCVCPTTELDLGDGTADVDRFLRSSVDLSLGSDSHAVIDLFDEVRLVEWNDRARYGRRGVHPPAALWQMAHEGGARTLGSGPWGITPGAPADWVVVDGHSTRTVGASTIEGLLGSVTSADVTATYIGGRQVAQSGAHVELGPVANLMADALDAVL